MPTPYRQTTAAKTPRIAPFLMYILPLPLLITAIVGLVQGNLKTMMVAIISLGWFWLAAWFLRQAHRYELASLRRKWQRRTRIPWRLSAAIFTGIGVTTVSLFLTNNSLILAVLVGILSALGISLAYGLDPQHDPKKDVNLVGVTSEEIIEVLEEAEDNLSELEKAADSIRNTELKVRLRRIVEKTRSVLNIIEEDPKDLRRARKFLKVYLDGAKQVSAKYARSHQMLDSAELENNFREVLTTIEQTVEEQREKLLENDALDLDVKIEVLLKQLKHEGVV